MSVAVGQLWHYPVKSMLGQAVEEVLLGPAGVVGDRAYGFVDVETEHLVSAKRPRRYAALFGCRAEFVVAPRVDEPVPPVAVTFPDGTVIEGDKDRIAKAVSELLGREVRMVTHVPAGVPYGRVRPPGWPAMINSRWAPTSRAAPGLPMTFRDAGGTLCGVAY